MSEQEKDSVTEETHAKEASPAERLAMRFARYYADLAPGYGYEHAPDDPTDWDRIRPKHRDLLVAVFGRILDDKKADDDAWFAWQMAGQMPGEQPVDPEAPPMPRSRWP